MMFRELDPICHLSLYDSKIYFSLITEFYLVLVSRLAVILCVI